MQLTGRTNLIAFVALAGALAIIPSFLSNNYQVSIFILIALYTILTVGLSLLMGYAGQISLGQAVFYGMGGYVTAWLTVRNGLPPLAGMFLAAVVTGLVAYFVGVPMLRLRGNYLAMATLGLNVIFELIVMQETAWTGGPDGFKGIPKFSIGEFVFQTDREMYFVVWAFALLIIVLSLNIVNSRSGRALRAVHASEIAAEMNGVDTAHYKVAVLVLSAVYASVAGSLYAFWLGIISPSVYHLSFSIELVVMVAIGGLASVWGAIFGAAMVTLLAEFLRNVLPQLLRGASGEQEIIAFGVILILVMIFLPEGLLTGSIARYRRWRAERKAVRDIEQATDILEPMQ
ncbi:MAG: branched-chain amino acid ABC transporter permease [Chloroflexi bacterium]|nr:branched-chain amino acid ABC transporter permease [Chloroflexota bacterium]